MKRGGLFIKRMQDKCGKKCSSPDKYCSCLWWVLERTNK